MMATLLIWRGRIRYFFEKHYLILRGLIKAVVAMATMMLLAGRFPEGFFSDKYWIFPAIAVICGVTPDAVSILAVVAVVGIEVWQISNVLAITILLMITIFFLLFGRKAKEQWYMLLSVPTLSVCHMGFSVPMVSALFAGPSMIPALIMGIILRFSLEGVAEYTATAQRVAGDANYLAPLQYLVDYLISNRSFLVALIVYTLTFIVIYYLRRANFRHAPQIAILVGAIVLYTMEMISNIIWELELNLILTSVLVIATMAIAYVFQFMHISLDYHGTRRLQFEDDEYYYYVTAIPKYNVAVGDKVITRILPEELEEEKADLKEEVEKVLAEEKQQSQSQSQSEEEKQ